MHKPISIKNICLSFSDRLILENVSADIFPMGRIGIVGDNGCGKSTLLKIIQGLLEVESGSIERSKDMVMGYVPQIIDNNVGLSGAECFNHALSSVMSHDLNCLLLDEPTNHLDSKNKRSLLRMLQNFKGTLMVASHDLELLNSCIDIIWHMKDGKIHVFKGTYQDYLHELDNARLSIIQEISQVKNQKKCAHEKLMKEQSRAAKSRDKGKKSIKQRKWPTIVSHAKVSRASQTSGQKKSDIKRHSQALDDKLIALKPKPSINPKFYFQTKVEHTKTILSVQNGMVGYAGRSLIQGISLSIMGSDRFAILGENASGKSSLVNAMLQSSHVMSAGSWCLPDVGDIGYLDQHYNQLSQDMTALEHLSLLAKSWDITQIRRHLRDFLFKDDTLVQTQVKYLSGGEKARLCLALVASKSPQLLILDEVTNNLDMSTQAHVIEVLQAYTGALLVISHDEHFLKAINIRQGYKIENNKLYFKAALFEN